MLHFVKKGNAPQKIVFIHGSSNAMNYWDSALESKWLTDYKLIALDLPGHGESFVSDFPERDYSIKGMSKILSEFLEEEIKENYILVGHCFGTNLIGECAESMTGCKGVFLTNPTILGKEKTPSDILQPNPLITPYFMADSNDEDLKILLEDAIICANENSKQILFDNYRNTDQRVRTVIAEAVISSNYSDEIAAIEKLKIPVAIAFGKEDTVTFPNYLDSIPFKLWRDEIIKIPDAGHYIQSDQPEKINQWLAMFAQDCFT
ncbi:alpha/beta hydrolase [Flavobacterium sufflavum]|uniref:Alpha/beta hydrolase n=1 Tax=Flavobacterium sufflavum TaxID=1921138 RepID=A0A3S3SVF1_9FLAO|nr:alpha/beta hydrolase [Flavobacterium sufflavum]RVT75734.1 alpha/beta hydrolase [Flavobacterium sufflavum]